jgi:signal transduction histidine kinase
MKAVKLGLGVLAVPLGVAAFRLLHDDLHQTEIRSLPAVVVGWTAIATGLVAWWQRPANRMGVLMTLFGFAVLVRTWQYSSDPTVFVFGFGLGGLSFALFGHVALAYPTGRVTDRLERLLLRAGYTTVVAFPLAMLLFTSDGAGLKYAPLAPESPLLVASNDELARALERAFVIVFFGFLSACFVALLLRKYVWATPRARRILAPLLVAALVAALRALYEFLSIFVSPIPTIADYVYWWQVAGQIALSLSIGWGLLSSRLAAVHVADLVRQLDRVPPHELRRALARAVGDPSLDLAFWLPERGGYADADGRPLELGHDPRRAVTYIEHDGEPIAALEHDPALNDDPRVLEAATAATRLALENARLQAELKAQLARVQESRARIVAAGDEERRRIERDIHDGAQQRLVALALELRVAQKRLGNDLAPGLEDVLADAVDELQLAVGELRELARGVHPAILTEEGLAAALESLADRTPIPVRLVATPAERFSPEIEGAAYFVACEALANTVKHAAATSVTITAVTRDGWLVIDVADDGVGGAAVDGGTGLRGLADRVEAHGGRFRIESPAGGGTRVIGVLPCAS